jgi:GWxTD domain-containing protein
VKKLFIYILLVGLIFPQNRNQRNLNRNIDQFRMTSFTRPLESGSVEIMSFVVIPNRSLQFIKEKNKFIAEYDANIFVTTDDEDVQVATGSFSDKIISNRFSETTSKVKSTVLNTSFVVPLGDYNISINVKDLDTKLSSKQNNKVELKQFSNDSQVYDPIFIKEAKGEWGFESNKFPIDANQIVVKNNEIQFYQYAVINAGVYEMVINILSGKEVQWSKTINSSSESRVISHLITVPTKDINRKDLKVQVSVNQKNSTKSRSLGFRFRNSFMPDSITNIDLALSQMNYILTSDERKELKKLKQSAKENFFKKAWARRDPKPDTKVNELMDEYYGRVSFTEENFSRGTSGGWRSDMGMIFILFGKPDDIQRHTSMQSNYSYETWYYFSIGQEFAFVDDYGFGDYRLRYPFVY